MRKSTAFLSTLVAASSITVAWSIGQQTLNDSVLLPIDTGALPVDSTTPSASQTSSAADSSATPANSSTPAPSNSQSSAPATSPSASASATAKPTASQTTSPSAKPSTTPAQAAPVVVTLSSDPIDYKYGVVQISMTKTDGKITDIKMVQGDATNGRAEAYVSLISATIQVQGTGYGNISGATYTVAAFKQAVDNVMAKF